MTAQASQAVPKIPQKFSKTWPCSGELCPRIHHLLPLTAARPPAFGAHPPVMEAGVSTAGYRSQLGSYSIVGSCVRIATDLRMRMWGSEVKYPTSWAANDPIIWGQSIFAGDRKIFFPLEENRSQRPPPHFGVIGSDQSLLANLSAYS